MGNFWSSPWKETDISAWNDEVLRTLKRDLFRYRNKEVNILLFGSTGQGKSAYVNTVYSALYGYQKTAATEAMDAMESITQGVQEYPLKDSSQLEDWKVTIIDMQGIERTVKLDEIIAILDGIVDKGGMKSEGFEKYNINKPIHAVLFCNMYKENIALSEDDEFFRACVEHACRKRIPVFLLMTKIDLSKQGFNASDVFYNGKLLIATRDASKTFGVPEKNILLQRNYSGVNDAINKRDIDILTLYNLRFILNNIMM